MLQEHCIIKICCLYHKNLLNRVMCWSFFTKRKMLKYDFTCVKVLIFVSCPWISFKKQKNESFKKVEKLVTKFFKNFVTKCKVCSSLVQKHSPITKQKILLLKPYGCRWILKVGGYEKEFRFKIKAIPVETDHHKHSNKGIWKKSVKISCNSLEAYIKAIRATLSMKLLSSLFFHLFLWNNQNL